MPRVAGADCADLRLSALVRQLRHAFHGHGAVMLPVTTAADRNAGVGILGQSQRWSDGRETNSGEQDEAEETREHERTGSVYALVS